MGKRRKNVTIVLFLTKVNVFATDFLVFHRVLISRFPQLINCTVGIKMSEIFSRRISQPKMIFSALASKRLFYLLF